VQLVFYPLLCLSSPITIPGCLLVDNNVNITKEVKDSDVDYVDKSVDETSDRLLSGADLAKRLGVNSGTLTRNRAKPNFTQWSTVK